MTPCISTLENTASLIEEFFDGLSIETHLDGNTVHVQNEKESEIKIHPFEDIELLSLSVMEAAGNTEENQEDWKLLLDRWDFAE